MQRYMFFFLMATFYSLLSCKGLQSAPSKKDELIVRPKVEPKVGPAVGSEVTSSVLEVKPVQEQQVNPASVWTGSLRILKEKFDSEAHSGDRAYVLISSGSMGGHAGQYLVIYNDQKCLGYTLPKTSLRISGQSTSSILTSTVIAQKDNNKCSSIQNLIPQEDTPTKVALGGVVYEYRHWTKENQNTKETRNQRFNLDANKDWQPLIDKISELFKK